MVFFSSCASVKYHAELLNYIDIPVKVGEGGSQSQCSLHSVPNVAVQLVLWSGCVVVLALVA
jgi:hypothetical protein